MSNTKLNWRDLQVKRKQPRMGKEPSILYFLETEIHSTRKRRTLNSGERACNQLKWVSKFEVWPSPLGICVASRLFCTVGHLESNVCLGEGRVQWSFTVLAPYIEKVCGIIVFGKFSCGAYVIVVLNSNTVVFLNMRNLFLIGSAIFSMVLSNSSIFLCGVTMFRIPLATL